MAVFGRVHRPFAFAFFGNIFLGRGLIEGTAQVLSSRNQREKEHRIEESQQFRE
jgi:hypothetical protein